MRTYAIYDAAIESTEPIGYLCYYERQKEYVIELRDDLSEWDAPLLFQKSVHDGELTILHEYAYRWVCERVIPSGRQNIMEILSNSKMREYDEFSLLIANKGVCSQDDCYLREVDEEEIPESIRNRKNGNISECFMTAGNSVVCLFRDNLVRKISLEILGRDYKPASYVANNELMQKCLRVDSGGYSISFDNNIVIPVKLLREEAYSEPLFAIDFMSYAKNGLTDTSGVCDMLDCTRQNVSYMVKEGKLKPIMNNSKEKIYTTGSVWNLE